jgi:hypothetical protein
MQKQNRQQFGNIPVTLMTINNSIRTLSILLSFWSCGALAQQQMMTAEEIQLINSSPNKLSFYLYIDGKWSSYYLSAGRDVIIKKKSLIIVVPTSNLEVADLPDPSVLSLSAGAYSFTDGYFARSLEGGSRGHFCWSQPKKAWGVKRAGESVCE